MYKRKDARIIAITNLTGRKKLRTRKINIQRKYKKYSGTFRNNGYGFSIMVGREH